jgi:hypothetical protein
LGLGETYQLGEFVQANILVRLECVRAVKAELSWIEIRSDLDLIPSGNLRFAADQPLYESIAW